MNIRFILTLVLMIGAVLGNATSSSNKKKGDATEEENVNDTKLLNVITTKKQFLLKEIIISLILSPEESHHIVFNLAIQRPQDATHTSYRADLPYIMDTIITDLVPILNQFQRDVNKELQASLEKRILRILNAKFNWIQHVEVQNLKIQMIEPTP